MNSKSCPECSEAIEENQRFCGHCSHELFSLKTGKSDDSIEETPIFVCADCNAGFMQKQTYCLRCGSAEVEITPEGLAKLESDKQLASSKAASGNVTWDRKILAVKQARTKIEELSAVRQEFYFSPEIPSVEIVTTPSHPTREILEVIGLVSGVSGATQGLFSFRSQQDLYEKAIEEAKFELAVSAVAIQANAVIGVQVIVNSNNPGSSTLAGGGMKSTETVALIGTAVKLK